jgi:hypothetical protein
MTVIRPLRRLARSGGCDGREREVDEGIEKEDPDLAANTNQVACIRIPRSRNVYPQMTCGQVRVGLQMGFSREGVTRCGILGRRSLAGGHP